MPHLRIEYSTNIVDRFDPAAVLDAAIRALMDSGAFNPADAVKARLMPVDHFQVGSGANHGFIHAGLALMSGRDGATKKNLTTALVDAIAPLLAAGPEVVQVTSEARDMDRDTYSKRVIQGS